jgi:hypothetical protein
MMELQRHESGRCSNRDYGDDPEQHPFPLHVKITRTYFDLTRFRPNLLSVFRSSHASFLHLISLAIRPRASEEAIVSKEPWSD